MAGPTKVRLYGKNSSGDHEQLESTDRAAHTLEQGLVAGETLYGSETRGFLTTRGKRRANIISITATVTINTGVANDTMLYGLRITAALTGTCVITGFGDEAGNATSITLPATTPAGWYEFGDTINEIGALTITCSTAGDSELVTAIWSSLV